MSCRRFNNGLNLRHKLSFIKIWKFQLKVWVIMRYFTLFCLCLEHTTMHRSQKMYYKANVYNEKYKKVLHFSDLSSIAWFKRFSDQAESEHQHIGCTMMHILFIFDNLKTQYLFHVWVFIIEVFCASIIKD